MKETNINFLANEVDIKSLRPSLLKTLEKGGA